MAAITAAFMSQVKSGQRVLLPSDGYYNSRGLAEKFLAPLGVEISTCPTASMTEQDLNGYALVMIETPANPGLDVCDIAIVAERAKAAGACLVADNTTATALLQQPLDFGADMVVSSDTKAISGHSDALFGHVASRNTAIMSRVRDWRTLSGAISSPFDAFLVHRGLETLEVRMERMSKNAMSVAEMLAASPLANSVRYPGLPHDPAHSVARKQMTAFGPIVSFELLDAASAEAFITICPLLSAATSFGGVHSSAERRGRWGDDVAAGFVRFSAGIEPTDELLAAVDTGLSALA
ncbi:UNVERIFIED_CONTAM: hypothetical protein GTU68_048288 [Idotea baltica]|nr:hypothetical protein [Idotea baltica]